MKKKKKVIALKVRIVVNSKGKRREGNEEGTHAGCFRGLAGIYFFNELVIT